MSKFCYKPWLDESDQQEVLFCSIHLYGEERFYPCSGQESEEDRRNNIINITMTPVGPGPWDQVTRAKLTAAKREAYCRQASDEFRSKVSSLLLPQLRAFLPDLLIISAGFDAHYDDYYHFLSEEDIHWLTAELCEAVEANPNSLGVISILEGGYSLESKVCEKPAKPGRTTKNSKTSPGESVDPHTMFAQLPGDGGLVKGVLAHVAALSGRKHW